MITIATRSLLTCAFILGTHALNASQAPTPGVETSFPRQHVAPENTHNAPILDEIAQQHARAREANEREHQEAIVRAARENQVTTE